MSLSLAAEPLPLETDVEGTVRMHKSRVSLDTVVSAFLNGATPEEIGQQYPSLHLADIYAVIAYYLRQRPAVEAYLHQRRLQAATARQQNEARFDPAGVRDRLLARHASSRA